MRYKLFANMIVCAVVLTPMIGRAQADPLRSARVEVRAHLVVPAQAKHRAVPAVMWLESVDGHPPLPFPPHARYTLTQHGKMFTPHLLIIPVGSMVSFPNEDPFFHNVFSLFDGKRFDLGLYEAGSSKEVPFVREGVSYIFCNIHPEMSAVIVALSTPVYASADASGSFVIHDVSPGDYAMHLWVEGVPQPVLDGFSRHMHISSGPVDLGGFQVSVTPKPTMSHANKFGGTYDQDSKQTY
jgi:hypothetical protein